MRKRYAIVLLVLSLAIPATAGSKLKGSATLKDVQPVGETSKKNKKQQYDLFFVATGKEYTCRVPYNKKMDATAFVVGSTIDYQIDGNKGKLKGAGGKHVDCTIVRVAEATAVQPATPPAAPQE
jgi:hypothetical protein